VRIDAGLLAYARSLDVFGLSGKVLAVLPVAEASGHATAKGQARDRDVFGVADPLLRFSVNLFGAPALSLEEFATYQQDLIIGASLQMTAPLGQYNSSKLLNLGTNRWSIKPELGLSKAWGPLTVELITAITFFTTNNDFFGGHTLEQDPIYSVQGHLICEVSRAFWVAFDGAYYVGGQTTVNGVEGQEPANVRLGMTAALSLNRYQSIKFYGSTGVYNRTQNNFWALGIAWQIRGAVAGEASEGLFNPSVCLKPWSDPAAVGKEGHPACFRCSASTPSPSIGTWTSRINVGVHHQGDVYVYVDRAPGAGWNGDDVS